MISLHLGDCLDILPTVEIPTGDLVLITDPPYGVSLGEIKNGQAIEKDQQAYNGFSDTPEYVADVVIPAITLALSLSARGIVTPGNKNAWLYPKPDDVGVWYNPAGTGRGKWGFILAHLILYYGKDPKAGRNAIASSVWGKNDSVSAIKNILHPCPKPLKFTKWLVTKGTNPGDTVLDPFMGSGTTGVACVQTGRNFIGIEIDPTYFEIAKRRVSDAQQQPMLLEVT